MFSSILAFMSQLAPFAPFAPFATDVLIRTTVLLALIAVATYLLRKRSAALRHFLWTLGILGLVAVPVLARAVPFRLHVLPVQADETSSVPAPSTATRDNGAPPSQVETPAVALSPNDLVLGDASGAGTGASAASAAAASIAVSRTNFLVALWLVGVVILLTRLVLGLAIIRRVSGRARALDAGTNVALANRAARSLDVSSPITLRLSDEVAMPFAHGLLRPTIVLPASFCDWSLDRRQAVLMHEIAHVSRGDLAMNLLSHVVRAVYWFHPLVWFAAHRVRVEGERACDDAVLREGSLPSDYAEHLLSIVRAVGKPVPSAALAMARQSDFEGRLLAILEPDVPRGRLTRLRAAALAAMFLLVLTPLAALTPARASGAPDGIVLAQEPQRAEPTAQSAGAVAALIETLGDANAAVRLAAIQSLGRLGDPRAIAALSKALREDTDARVREAAAHSLGEIDDVRAVPALIEALKAERVAKVREKIVHALGEIDDPAALGAISAVVKDPSVAVRREVAWALGELDDQDAVPALITMTRDDDAEVRKHAAEALGQLENPSAIDALASLTRDQDADVRVHAINALGQLEDLRALPSLVAALKDPDAEVRSQAADAIHGLEGINKAPPALIELLSDSNRDVRKNAANALGGIGDPTAVPALKRATADTDSDVRRHAAEALSEIGGPEAIQVLMGLLKDQDPEVRRIAAEALGHRRR